MGTLKTNIIKSPTINTRVRLFGILFLDDYRDDMNIFVEDRAENRVQLDDPTVLKKSVFKQVTFLMSNEEIVVADPPGWEITLLHKDTNERLSYNKHWE